MKSIEGEQSGMDIQHAFVWAIRTVTALVQEFPAEPGEEDRRLAPQNFIVGAFIAAHELAGEEDWNFDDDGCFILKARVAVHYADWVSEMGFAHPDNAAEARQFFMDQAVSDWLED